MLTLKRKRSEFFRLYTVFEIQKDIYRRITNDLDRRLYEHKQNLLKGFTAKYNIDRLVYFEQFDDIQQAIARETQLKDWRREKKVKLIEGMNPEWKDLSKDWDS